MNYKKIAIISISALIILIGTNIFFDNFRLRTPIIIKLQLPIEQRTKEQQKPLIKKVKAQEIKPTMTPTPTQKPTIQTFKKYLTPDADKVRTKVLSMAQIKYSGDDLIALDNILKKEAGYRTDAVNEIGACGMVQAYPCEKMKCALDYSDEAIKCQYDWVINYIENRYKTPSLAWQFHLVNNWY